MKTKNCSAFTLPEILVVIAIIVILAVVFIPGFANSAQRAKQNTCYGNLIKIQQIKEDYSGSKETIRYNDIAGEVKRRLRVKGDLPFCPLDPNRLFETSYRVNNFNQNPECLVQGDGIPFDGRKHAYRHMLKWIEHNEKIQYP